MLIPMGFLAASGAGALPAYELISTTLISSNTANVTFDVSSYASTYKHLQIRYLAKTTDGSGSNVTLMRFNNVSTGTLYSYHFMRGSGSSPSASQGFTANQMQIAQLASTYADTHSAGIIEIPEAFSSTKNKTAKATSGLLGGSTNYIAFYSGAFHNTAAINSILLYPNSGSFESGSRFSIYGLKG